MRSRRPGYYIAEQAESIISSIGCVWLVAVKPPGPSTSRYYVSYVAL